MRPSSRLMRLVWLERMRVELAGILIFTCIMGQGHIFAEKKQLY